jgi:hypothetical protein
MADALPFGLYRFGIELDFFFGLTREDILKTNKQSLYECILYFNSIRTFREKNHLRKQFGLNYFNSNLWFI